MKLYKLPTPTEYTTNHRVPNRPEIKEADSSSDEEDATAELAKQLKRANKDITNIQAIFNENATALKQLQA
ncbi:hypothetical protein CSPAE12_03744 [Colletotrichum incanum]|nr:hypothetical protein CSPAE12_03744 [Colletotrichum incanum]